MRGSVSRVHGFRMASRRDRHSDSQESRPASTRRLELQLGTRYLYSLDPLCFSHSPRGLAGGSRAVELELKRTTLLGLSALASEPQGFISMAQLQGAGRIADAWKGVNPDQPGGAPIIFGLQGRHVSLAASCADALQDSQYIFPSAPQDIGDRNELARLTPGVQERPDPATCTPDVLPVCAEDAVFCAGPACGYHGPGHLSLAFRQ